MKIRSDKGFLAGFASAVSALLFIGLLTYQNGQQYANTNKWVSHTHEVLYQLEKVMVSAVDAETGERGYIITGDTMYLEPFNASRNKLNGGLDRLGHLTADNPTQQQNIATLGMDANKLIIRLGQCIEVRRKDGFARAQAMVVSGQDKLILDDIRQQVNLVKNVELKILAARATDSEHDQHNFTLVFMVLIFTCIFFLAISYFIISNSLHALKKSEKETANKNTELEEKMLLLKQSEARLLANQTALSEANAELQKTNKELASFAYISSHDLQEPLRKIMIFADMVEHREGEKVSAFGKANIAKIQKSAKYMRKLIEDLLAYSMSDKTDKAFEKTDLNLLLADVKNVVGQNIQTIGGTMVYGTMPVLKIISYQIVQLFTNLILNSVKFARQGVPLSINIQAAKTSREVDGTQRKYWRISVTDNGIGFDTQYAERIFEVFQRLHKEEYEGTGIGLAICKRIAENHHGFITATGKPNDGATFDLYLPVEQ
jgi:signal transduction histidine kinase